MIADRLVSRNKKVNKIHNIDIYVNNSISTFQGRDIADFEIDSANLRITIITINGKEHTYIGCPFHIKADYEEE